MVSEWTVVAGDYGGAREGAMCPEAEGGVACVGAGSEGDVRLFVRWYMCTQSSALASRGHHSSLDEDGGHEIGVQLQHSCNQQFPVAAVQKDQAYVSHRTL
jgi:hypothetical protein